MLEQFLNTVDRLVNTLQSYPEAPYIIGALTLIFAVSFILVLREVMAWFLKTAKIASQNTELQQELKEIRYTLKQITDTLNVDPTRYIPKSKLGSTFSKPDFTESDLARPKFNKSATSKPDHASEERSSFSGPTSLSSTTTATSRNEKIENKIFQRSSSSENIIKDAVAEKAREKGFPLSH